MRSVKEERLQELMGQGFTTWELASQLGVTKSWIIKAMHHLAEPLSKSLYCSSRIRCENLSLNIHGILMTSGKWYCRRCYWRWADINHKFVKCYTRTGTTEGILPDKSMTRRVCITSQEFADLKDRVAQNVSAIRMTTKEIEASLKKLFSITESPEGWDIILYYKKQAFLRFDGVIVHQTNSNDQIWYIRTTCELIEVAIDWKTHLEAIAAANKHIPMGDLL